MRIIDQNQIQSADTTPWEEGANALSITVTVSNETAAVRTAADTELTVIGPVMTSGQRWSLLGNGKESKHTDKEGKDKKEVAPIPESRITLSDVADVINLRAAVAMVRKNAQNLKQPARGRLRDFCSRLDTATMQQLLMGGHYVPQPYKQVKHQNKEGKVRILGIPSHSDRVAQMALKLVFEPACEARLFRDESYAFRPDRAVKDAISAVWEHHENGRVWTAKADIHSFFDSINLPGCSKLSTRDWELAMK